MPPARRARRRHARIPAVASGIRKGQSFLEPIYAQGRGAGFACALALALAPLLDVPASTRPSFRPRILSPMAAIARGCRRVASACVSMTLALASRRLSASLRADARSRLHPAFSPPTCKQVEGGGGGNKQQRCGQPPLPPRPGRLARIQRKLGLIRRSLVCRMAHVSAPALLCHALAPRQRVLRRLFAPLLFFSRLCGCCCSSPPCSCFLSFFPCRIPIRKLDESVSLSRHKHARGLGGT